MMIIDAQVHIWAPETPEKPYAVGEASEPHRPIPLGHEELLREMDGAGVHRCVLVPPTWEADRNDTSLEAARLHPDRFAVMGRLKINAPESRALVATWKDQPHMLGIRMVFNRGRSREWLDDGTADWFWACRGTLRYPGDGLCARRSSETRRHRRKASRVAHDHRSYGTEHGVAR